ncbi:MAG TPA: FAD-binding protein, partial [Pyrinomonadaceae bacterium]|nr:FAD-binding protein [Pyrinomonadaceae bacterium]
MPPAIKLRSNTPLAPLTTLKVGGAARYFVEVSSEDELIKALGFAKENDLNLFILGGGSNVVISDSGFDGLVVKIAIKGMIETAREGKRVELSVGAGEDWDSFVAFAVDRGLTGVECLSGIPGLVGGTPIQNVGAYGQEVSETIVSVRCLDRLSGAIVEMTNVDCSFSYRKSIFNSTSRERYIVTSVKFELIRDGVLKLAYTELIE